MDKPLQGESTGFPNPALDMGRLEQELRAVIVGTWIARAFLVAAGIGVLCRAFLGGA